MTDPKIPAPEPVAWADNRAAAGRIGSVESTAVKANWEKTGHFRPAAERLTHPLITLESAETYAAAREAAARMQEREAQAAERDKLNGERFDLALLIKRLIVRMGAAREGHGIAAGDEALRAQALGYLMRKGLDGTPLRDDQGAIRAD